MNNSIVTQGFLLNSQHVVSHPTQKFYFLLEAALTLEEHMRELPVSPSHKHACSVKDPYKPQHVTVV